MSIAELRNIIYAIIKITIMMTTTTARIILIMIIIIIIIIIIIVNFTALLLAFAELSYVQYVGRTVKL